MAAEQTKSARECNNELRARRAQLDADGISVREFIDDCWWHSEPGQPTPLPVRQSQVPAGARAPVAARTTTAAAGPAAARPTRLRADGIVPAQSTSARLEPRRPTPTRLARRHVRFARVESPRPARPVSDELVRQPAPVRENQVASAGIPAGALSGRRMWLAVSELGRTAPKLPAVLLEETAVSPAKSLHCWSQQVLFIPGARPAASGHYGQSLVCDGKQPASATWGGLVPEYRFVALASDPVRHHVVRHRLHVALSRAAHRGAFRRGGRRASAPPVAGNRR